MSRSDNKKPLEPPSLFSEEVALSKEEIIRIKTEEQDKIISESLNYSNILYKLYTGFGKSRCATKRIKFSSSKKKWLVLVPKTLLIQNFWDDYIKWGGNSELIQDILCYDSLHKYEGTEFNVCCDEAAHVTDLVLEQMKTIQSDERIFLSATITVEVRDRIKNKYEDLKWWVFPLSKGIKMGIAPAQDIRIIKIPLQKDDEIWEHEIKGKYYNFSSEKKYQLLNKNISYWRELFIEEKKKWQENKMLQAASARKNWMAEYKINECKNLLQHLDDLDKRYICFVNSVEQAKLLGGKTAIHSKQKSSINQELVNKFNNFEENRLFSKDILAEGMNLEAVENCVFLHFDHSKGAVEQKVGRIAARTDFPVIYALVIPGTKDEDNFNFMFKDYKQYITEYTL